jgi:hypothetical protein
VSTALVHLSTHTGSCGSGAAAAAAGSTQRTAQWAVYSTETAAAQHAKSLLCCSCCHIRAQAAWQPCCLCAQVPVCCLYSQRQCACNVQGKGGKSVVQGKGGKDATHTARRLGIGRRREIFPEGWEGGGRYCSKTVLFAHSTPVQMLCGVQMQRVPPATGWCAAKCSAVRYRAKTAAATPAKRSAVRYRAKAAAATPAKRSAVRYRAKAAAATTDRKELHAATACTHSEGGLTVTSVADAFWTSTGHQYQCHRSLRAAPAPAAAVLTVVLAAAARAVTHGPVQPPYHGSCIHAQHVWQQQ